VRDLALDLGLALVIVARPGLGTINHTLLTLEAARAAGLAVAGVVMTPWPDQPGEIEDSNLRTVEDLGAVAVSPLPATRPEALARAGAGLPLAEWLGSSHNAPQ
jgi:dethiobiotin synthetase